MKATLLTLLCGGVCSLEQLVSIIVRLLGERTPPPAPKHTDAPDKSGLSWPRRSLKQLFLKAGMHGALWGGSDTAFSISLFYHHGRMAVSLSLASSSAED